MHIFLTGDIQVGKTRIIEKTTELLDLDYGGFKTYFGPDRHLLDRLLYINSASEPNLYNKEKTIVQFNENSKPTVILNRFDTYGVELIRDAMTNKQLIIMDECGKLERDSFEFQNQVLEAIEGNIPILGVIKLDSSGWVDKIRNHPKVELIWVDKENRNELPEIILGKLNKYIQKNKGL